MQGFLKKFRKLLRFSHARVRAADPAASILFPPDKPGIHHEPLRAGHDAVHEYRPLDVAKLLHPDGIFTKIPRKLPVLRLLMFSKILAMMVVLEQIALKHRMPTAEGLY